MIRVFKNISDKSQYLIDNYPFGKPPKLTDYKRCIHCNMKFMVADFRVEIQGGDEFIVCPNELCDGTLLDWFPANKPKKYDKS